MPRPVWGAVSQNALACVLSTRMECIGQENPICLSHSDISSPPETDNWGSAVRSSPHSVAEYTGQGILHPPVYLSYLG